MLNATLTGTIAMVLHSNVKMKHKFFIYIKSVKADERFKVALIII